MECESVAEARDSGDAGELRAERTRVAQKNGEVGKNGGRKEVNGEHLSQRLSCHIVGKCCRNSWFHALELLPAVNRERCVGRPERRSERHNSGPVADLRSGFVGTDAVDESASVGNVFAEARCVSPLSIPARKEHHLSGMEATTTSKAMVAC